MWVNDAQNKIFTIVKYRAKKQLVNAFPNIEFTTNIETGEPTSFPSVYIHFMPSAEMGGDVENTGINAFLRSASSSYGDRGNGRKVLSGGQLGSFIPIQGFGFRGNNDARIYKNGKCGYPSDDIQSPQTHRSK